MKTLFSIMKKRKNAIPEETLAIFENIINTDFIPNRGSKFMEAIIEHLTEEQRLRLYEQAGGCYGPGHDKKRKAFALEHSHKPLPEKLDLYVNTLGKELSTKTLNIVLDEENNTITTTFACDECYKRSIKGKTTAPFKIYYEFCAGGRMYYLTKALGIKLRIKSMDIPASDIGIENPCVYTFEIIG